MKKFSPKTEQREDDGEDAPQPPKRATLKNTKASNGEIGAIARPCKKMPTHGAHSAGSTPIDLPRLRAAPRGER